MAILPVAVVAVLFVAWTWFLHRQSSGRMWTPLWLAFGTTFGSAVFLVAGLVGYRLSRRSEIRWVDSPVWWQIWVGLALSGLAVFFWRRGVRSLRVSLSPRP